MTEKFRCWEDVVFEHRLKAYGAYRLRCEYPFSLSAAAGLVLFLFLAVMSGPMLFRGKQSAPVPEGKKGVLINYTALSSPPLIEKISPPPAPRAETTVVQQKPVAKRYVPPKVTRREVVESQEVPTAAEAKAETGTSGAAGASTVSAGGGSGSSGVGTGGPSGELTIQKDPEFPGGKAKLTAWLQGNLHYPPPAVRLGIEGVVKVGFTVDANGDIANVTVLDPLYKFCDKEAVRLISSMPRWIPGEINGVRSTTTYTIPIRFKLT